MPKNIKLAVVLASVALLAAGCNNSSTTTNTNSNTDAMTNNQPTANQQNQNTNSAESTPPATGGSQVKTFTVKGQNFSFSPSEIRVKKGDKVKIVFENVGGFHDWVVDEFNARTKQIGDGQSDSVEFVADKTGTFEYYCSVGKHRQMGMKGNLVVE